MKTYSTSAYNFLFYFVLLLTCIVIFYQSPLAPQAKSSIGNDSSIFITIGQNILQGDILYKDCTDHKGPMVFIMNAIGLKFGGLTGIWLFEILSLYLSSIFIYKTTCFLSTKFNAFIATIFSLLFIIPIISGGNLTEIWVLPYISIALFIFVNHLTKINKALTSLQILILSFTLIMAFMFKASYVALWVAFGFIIFIRLIIEKNYQRLCFYFLKIFFFSSIILMPFFLYFYYHNALYDAYYWMIKYNIEYGVTHNFLSSLLFTLQIIFGVRHLPIIVICTIIFAFITKDYKQNKYLFYGFTLSICITAYTCAIGNRYEHYNIIFSPLLSLPYVYLFRHLDINSFRKKIIILIAVSGSGYVFLAKQLDSRNYNEIFQNKTVINVANIVKENSKPEDTIIGDNFVDRAIYVYSKRKCANKYLSNAYSPDITNEILQKKPTIIICNNQHTPLNDTILELYTLINTYNTYNIYKIHVEE